MLNEKTYVSLLWLLLVYREVCGKCTPGTSRPATSNCIVYDTPSVKSFDGNLISVNSKCGYTLTSIQSNGVNLDVNFFQNTSTLQTIYAGNTYELISKNDIIDLTANGKRVTIPYYLNGISVTKPGNKVLSEIVTIGMKTRFDGKVVEIVQNNELIAYDMIGLCGNNDGCKDNDLIMKNGKEAPSVEKFFDSWSIGGCTSTSYDNQCGTNTRLQTQAKAFCENLFKNEKFAKCQEFTSEFMTVCTSNYCGCKLANRNNCMCDMLDTFARTCQAKTNELISWRSSQLCPIDCRNPDQEYMSCAPNKRQLTCGQDEVDPTKFDCEEGCYCPQGLRLFQDKCVFIDDCPCVYETTVYKPGATMSQDCNTCTCKQGKWDCSTKICTVEASCVGDPHYTTFDGKRYDFMGKCRYYVVRGNGFDVICDHYIWNGAFVKDEKSTGPSYCAKVIVNIQDDVIELGQKLDVKLNGEKLNWFPYISYEFRIAQPSSQQVTVSMRNYVTVKWNGDSYCAVSIPTTMKGRVKGLFGTYTKTQDDDFLTSNGTITTDPVAFGNSWKVPNSCQNEYTGPVAHPCAGNKDKQTKAEKDCAPLKSKLFEGCLDDVEGNFQNCVYDACSCKPEQTNCLCEFYAVQAKQCAAKGKHIDWRNSVPGCEIKCPAGQTYQTCRNPCARSCDDIATDPACDVNNKDNCVEGCNCPEGQTLDGKNQCIPINKCPCVWEDNRFNPDFTFIDGDNKRVCVNAKWKATVATPDDKNKYPTLGDLNKKCKTDVFEVYSGCKRTNVVTCFNKHLNEQPNYENCKSGCECGKGFVFDTELDTCTRPDDCPCMHDGISYPEKSERQDKDRKCVCHDGIWTCSDNNKDHWETCSVWGNIHVRTFDETVYTFNGNCDYTLLERKLEGNGVFRVTMKTDKCDVGSCKTNIHIYYKDNKGIEDNVVIENKKKFTPPKKLTNLIVSNLDLSIMIDVVGLGVRVIWNTNGWVHIHVARIWTTWEHGGLCGKYDDNPDDDLHTPDKLVGVAQLVDYYRVDKKCEGSKQLPKVNLILLNNPCEILRSETFKTCRLLKKEDEYYDACLIDENLQLFANKDKRWDVHCESLSAYAQECNDLNSPVTWRTDKICPAKCEAKKVYTSCETPCAKETCHNTNVYQKCPDKVCAESCSPKPCPENSVYKDDNYKECVVRDKCPNNGCAPCPKIEKEL